MQALRINPVSERIKLQSLDLLRTLILTSSGSKSFYSYLSNLKENSVVKRTVMGRVKEFCGYYHINLYKYIFNNKYRQNIKYCTYKSVQDGQNGIIDTLRNLFKRYNTRCRDLALGLLKAF